MNCANSEFPLKNLFIASQYILVEGKIIPYHSLKSKLFCYILGRSISHRYPELLISQQAKNQPRYRMGITQRHEETSISNNNLFWDATDLARHNRIYTTGPRPQELL